MLNNQSIGPVQHHYWLIRFCQVLFGRMSDIFGRKNVIMTCLMILVIGDIACSVARNGMNFCV